MDRFQPIQDTFGLLAGVQVPRTPRPGEKFEIVERQRKSRRNWLPIRVLIMTALLKARTL